MSERILARSGRPNIFKGDMYSELLIHIRSRYLHGQSLRLSKLSDLEKVETALPTIDKYYTEAKIDTLVKGWADSKRAGVKPFTTATKKDPPKTATKTPAAKSSPAPKTPPKAAVKDTPAATKKAASKPKPRKQRIIFEGRAADKAVTIYSYAPPLKHEPTYTGIKHKVGVIRKVLNGWQFGKGGARIYPTLNLAKCAARVEYQGG